MRANYEVKTGDRNISIDFIEVTVNSTNAPVIATDRGKVMSATAGDHTRDGTGSYTLTLRKKHNFVFAMAQVEGADDDQAKIDDVVQGISATNTLGLTTLNGITIADLTSKTVRIMVVTSRSYRS